MKSPVVYQVEDKLDSLKQFEERITASKSRKDKEIALQYPVVYIHNWENENKYEVYVGQTNDVIRRTSEHFSTGKNKEKWQKELLKHNALLYIIGHEHFNESLTKDIENRLMNYLMCVDDVERVHNGRGNPQNKYYPSYEMDEVFSKIWRKLRKENSKLFPSESVIKDSALFKASPLHKLTKKQEEASETIIKTIEKCINKKTKKHQLVFVDGDAGTGKTVLTSSTFYNIHSKLCEQREEVDFNGCFLVNNRDLIKVYKQIVDKLGIKNKNKTPVMRPTTFIGNTDKNNPVDFVFIDEAHLLLTKNTYYYKKKYDGLQIKEIMDRAKITVVMFDSDQVMSMDQYWKKEIVDELRSISRNQGNYCKLDEQLRMNADKQTMNWIDTLTKKGRIKKLHKKDYDIEVFDDPKAMYEKIKGKNKKDSSSRVVATYDWDYSPTKGKETLGKRAYAYWEVSIGKWHKPWNHEISRYDKEERQRTGGLTWVEQPKTINEIGSIHSVQGFDLNYVGVILGPSVTYRNGKIVFDPSKSKNKNMTKRSKNEKTGEYESHAKELLRHEIRVLMTRGVNGLYIYACDDALRDALKAALEE